MPDFAPHPFHVTAADGTALHGSFWLGAGEGAKPVVTIHCATAVHSRYYARFAAWLAAKGFDVLTYDYRGIGGSHPGRLRGFAADWIDWARL
ncbi:MAG: serine aminopeptidase domain-containing protein, partial [Elstera sp.]